MGIKCVQIWGKLRLIVQIQDVSKKPNVLRGGALRKRLDLGSAIADLLLGGRPWMEVRAGGVIWKGLSPDPAPPFALCFLAAMPCVNSFSTPYPSAMLLLAWSQLTLD